MRPTIAFTRPKPLHVAVIAPPWMELPPTGYGGIEAVCADLIAALLRGGQRVTLVGAGRNGTGATFVQTYDRPQGERIGQTVPEVVHAAALPAILADLHVDLVHDHTLAGPLLALAHGLPTVVTAHGPVDGELGSYYRNISRWVHLVAISDAQRTCAPAIRWRGTVHNALEPAAYPVTMHRPRALPRGGRGPVQRRPDGRGLRVDLPAGRVVARAGGRLRADRRGSRPPPADARRRGTRPRTGPEDVVTGPGCRRRADRSGVSVPVTPVCPAGRTRWTGRGWDGSRCQPARTSVGRGIESTGDQR